METARQNNAELVLFPELALSGYGCEDYFFMPWLYQKAWDVFWDEFLPLTRDLFAAVGMPLRFEGKSYNSLALVENGKPKGFYLKQRLPHTGVFYEPRWFSPGKAGWQSEMETPAGPVPVGDFCLSWKGLQLGFEICEDAWDPEERPAVKGAARAADLILNPSASNYARGKQAERHALITTLGGKHPGFYLYTNLLGNESGRLIFDGEILFGKAGKVWASTPLLSMEDVRVVAFSLEPEGQPDYHLAKENDFEEFTDAACLGLLDYLRKAGSRGFALSLSGGADSGTCAVLVAEMLRRAHAELGKEKLEAKLGFSLVGNTLRDWVKQLMVCVYQSTENSGPVTRQAACQLAKELGAEYLEWDLTQPLQAYTETIENSIGRTLRWETDDLSLQNIQARVRAPGIWFLANTRNFLVLTTSNRSEGDVGYCTMDGDTAGSLAPLAGVSKHFIRRWMVWARDQLGYASLDAIIQQAPTAELRPPQSGQTDEADLMPYDLLEAIEEAFLFRRIAPDQIPRELARSRPESEMELTTAVTLFLTLWKRNQWKRERLAPSFHLDRFNIDPKSEGRYPIFSR